MLRAVCMGLLLAMTAGCGSDAGFNVATVKSVRNEPADVYDDSLATRSAAPQEEPNHGPPAAGADLPAGDTPPPGQLTRKIIYTADVHLWVEDFQGVPERVDALVTQYGGYVANSSISGSLRERRTGTWRLRVPVEKYEAFRQAVLDLGELRSVSSNAQDVSEEYYDVEARIRNKTVEEQRLLKHLEDSTSQLKDILEVERELSRVREELERLQGRMRVLKDLTALTTVTLRIEEIKDFVPEQAATLGDKVRRTWHGSLAALTITGESLLLLGVHLTPWLPVIAVVGLGGWWLLRRLLRAMVRSLRRA